MSDVLVDTSAWVDFLRGEAVAVRRVDALLAEGRVAITGPVYAEVVSGAQSRAVFDRLTRLLCALELLSAPATVWQQIADARFALARQGFQSHVVDLVIAVTALHTGHSLLTRDRDFEGISRVLPVEVALFQGPLARSSTQLRVRKRPPERVDQAVAGSRAGDPDQVQRLVHNSANARWTASWT